MDDEKFNISMRKFLKMVGVTSQREIEKAVAQAREDKSIAGNESFPAVMILEIAGLKLNLKLEGKIELE